MYKLLHAPATFALRHLPQTLQLAVFDDDAAVRTIELCLVRVTGDTYKKRMLPTDGFVSEAGSYSIYSATLSPDLLSGEALSYFFVLDGEAGEKYSVPLYDAGKMPPLTISEMSSWGGDFGKYIELVNLTADPLDLYDFELLKVEDSGKRGRNPLSDAQGVNVLPPFGRAALRFFDPQFLGKGLSPEVEVAYAALAAQYPASCADIAEQAPLFFSATTAQMGEDGQYAFLPECFDLYGKYTPRTLYLVPRGENEEKALFSAELSKSEARRDVRHLHAQLWHFDPRAPRVGVLQSNFVEPTPGFLHPAEAAVSLADHTVPSILPIKPESRVFLSEGALSIAFAVVATAPQCRAAVYVRQGEEFVAYESQMNEKGLYEVTVSEDVLSRMHGKLDYYIEATGGLYTARLGSVKAPLSVCLTDNAGPRLLSLYPAPHAALENEFQPQIRACYYDISGVNTRISTLCLDGLSVTENAVFEADALTYTPTAPLSLGTHVIELTLRDMLGNRSYYKSEFVITDGSDLQLFCGQVHCHTAESDGFGTPEEAIRFAREESKLDFFAVTDHTHYMEGADYDRQRRLADKENKPLEFACLYGFEMTWNSSNGFFGHTNLLGTDWITLSPKHTDMYEYYARVAADENAVAMFNHPDELWGNANEFEWRGDEIADRYCLAEINGAHYDPYYALALSKGWRVAPLYNEDNHDTSWGASGAVGYVLAHSLTRENVLDAFRRRRTYSTTDRTMKISYKVNDAWLGAVIEAPEKLLVEIEVTTEKESGIGRLAIVAEDNIEVAAVDAGALASFSWQVELASDFDYYYLRITNGEDYTVTAPVFVEGRNKLNITRMNYGVSEDASDPHVVTATVKNESDKTITDVTVDLYLSDYDGFLLRHLTPFESVHIGKLAAGEAHTVSRRLPDVCCRRRVSAVLSGVQGKVRYADTAYVMISPVSITKILPLSSPIEKDGVLVENPFAYAELYNHTEKPLELNGYSLRLWSSIGQSKPFLQNTLPLDGVKVAPHSTLVVWMRPAGSALTAENFNARFGTALVEGENLLITEKEILSPVPLARRLDIFEREHILTRVAYGYFCSHERDVEVDVPCLYAFAPHMTVQQKRISQKKIEMLPLPGELLTAQIPKTLKGLCRRREILEADRAKTKKQVVTKLTKAPLVPLRAASLLANAVSAFKGILSEKE